MKWNNILLTCVHMKVGHFGEGFHVHQGINELYDTLARFVWSLDGRIYMALNCKTENRKARSVTERNSCN